MSFSFFSRPHPLLPPVASLSISQLDHQPQSTQKNAWEQSRNWGNPTAQGEHERLEQGARARADGRPLPLFLPGPSTDLSCLPSSSSNEGTPSSPPPLHLVLPADKDNPTTNSWDATLQPQAGARSDSARASLVGAAAGQLLFGRGETDLTEFGSVFAGAQQAAADGTGKEWAWRDDDDVEVVARAENMKQLLAMPYSKQRVSLAVHRVGDTLLIDKPSAEEKAHAQQLFLEQARIRGMDRGEAAGQHEQNAEEEEQPRKEDGDVNSESVKPAEGERKRRPRKRKGKETRELQKALYDSLVGTALPQAADSHERQGQGDARGGGQAAREGQELVVSFPAKGQRLVQHDGAEDGAAAAAEREEEEQRGGAEAGGWRVGDLAKQWEVSDSESDEEAGEMGAAAASSPASVRLCRWNLGGMKMLLGSDLMVLGTPAQPCVSLYLRDPDAMTASSYLSVWLDNVMASVPHVLLCWHKEAVVQGYLVKRTEDIPELTQFAFSPQRVQSNGKQVLEWLKQECRREASTYWLYRERGDDLLRLFALTSSHAAQDSQVPPRYALPVAMLCLRAASRVSGSHKPEHRSRRRDLLSKAASLLEQPDHAFLYATAQEGMADTYVMVGGGQSYEARVTTATELGVVDSYQAVHADTFVLSSSDKRKDTEKAASHLSRALARLALSRPSLLLYRVRRKALDCFVFLANCHVAKGRPDLAVPLLGSAFGCALPLAGGTVTREVSVLLSKLRCAAGDAMLAAARHIADPAMWGALGGRGQSPEGDEPEAQGGAEAGEQAGGDSDGDERKQSETARGAETRATADEVRGGQGGGGGQGESVVVAGEHLPRFKAVTELTAEEALWEALRHYQRGRGYLDPRQDRLEWVRFTCRAGNTFNELGTLAVRHNDLLKAEERWRAGVVEFSKVGDGENEALVRCNVGKLLVERGRSAQVGGADDAAQEDAGAGRGVQRLTVEARTHYANAIGMLEAGFQALKNKHTNPGIWKSLSMELAGVLKRFADALAAEVLDTQGWRHSEGADREDGQLVVDLLLKAETLYEGVSESLHAATVYLSLGSFYARSLNTSRRRFEAAETQLRRAATLALEAGAGRGLYLRAVSRLASMQHSPHSPQPKPAALRLAAQTLAMPLRLPVADDTSHEEAVSDEAQARLQAEEAGGWREVMGAVRGLLKEAAANAKGEAQAGAKALYLDALRAKEADSATLLPLLQRLELALPP